MRLRGKAEAAPTYAEFFVSFVASHSRSIDTKIVAIVVKLGMKT